MEFSIVESLSGLQESIFSLFRSPQLNSHKKSKKISNFIKLPPLPLLAHVGPMAVWGPLGCCYLEKTLEGAAACETTATKGCAGLTECIFSTVT